MLIHRVRTATVIVAVAVCSPLHPSAQPGSATAGQMMKDIRKALGNLPYYGVFDLLSYRVDNAGVVTLGGYVVNASLKTDAQKEASEVPGVKEVQNKIEVAPVSQLDDGIRHGLYHAIYGDPALSRYGPARAQAGWGGTMSGSRWAAAPFYGLDFAGDYSIHLLVKNGSVSLAGMVDNEGDKSLAGIRARGVSGVKDVSNDLQIRAKK